MSLKIDTSIPCLDLKNQHRSLKEEIFEAFEQVYDNTAFSGGRFVAQLERSFANFCQVEHAVAVNNGTNALHLALVVLNIGPGDEVILPGNTFIATAWAISYVGATPIFVDCLEDTWEIDPKKIQEAISSKTKAIIGVHLYGQPCDMNSLKAIANKHDLFLIEDAAQAHGATYMDQPIGSIGDLACFSFYPGKNLGACGEGGMITTNNAAYSERLQRLRNHGSVEKYTHIELGYNMRMGGFEAASLSVKLKYIGLWNEKRRDIAKRYFGEIRNSNIRMQKQEEFCDSVYHLFVIIVSDRYDFLQYLAKHNIQGALHYPVPCHLQEAYSYLEYKVGSLPNVENLASHCVSLPMFAELSNEEVSHVIETLNNYSINGQK
ncbi:MAG: DegT/DnrJ/EryC1/StrS family aminotransferase [Reichenbachiella sp.]|uniref:DegT/DnrJ/EryC1/StrS family aminotransferase n=1 Tax=Reichenbachiella sp. TaxID=2184521 RepID=UPI0032644025